MGSIQQYLYYDNALYELTGIFPIGSTDSTSEAMETPAFIIEHPNLAEFLNYHIEVYMQYRASYLAQLADAEKNNPRHAKEMKDSARRRGDDF